LSFLKKMFKRESLDEKIKRLWESAKKLGWSDVDCKKKIQIYTELLNLIDENSTTFNICAILRNRAISYRSLKDYDSALKDLKEELKIAQRKGDQIRVMDCKKIIEETNNFKRKAEIEAIGGKKAERFKEMEKQENKLWGSGSDFDMAFETLFKDLESDDPDIRSYATRLLAESSRNALQKLISIYQECLNTNPNRSSLAGRVLGRKIAKGSDESITSEIARIYYGINVSFISCSCVYCSHTNKGIAAPVNGPRVPYYHQENDKGAYAVPVLCDRCGKTFFVVWDKDPR